MGLMFMDNDSQKVSEETSHNQPALVRRLLDSVDKITKIDKSKHRWGIFFKSLGFLYLFLFFILAGGALIKNLMPKEEHVAVVVLSGPILENEKASAGRINAALRQAFEAESSVAVMLAINSPGGSPVQSSYIYKEMRRLRGLHPEKPLYAVISDVGASGAYYVAAAADEIYANESSLIGSIGVTATSFGFTGLIEKLGVERRQYTSGEHKAFLDPFQAEKPEEAKFWGEVLGSVHQHFIDAVERGRGDRLKKSDDLYSGLIWDGGRALDAGLIDGYASVRSLARDKFESETLYVYGKQDRLSDLLNTLGVSIGQSLTASLGGTTVLH